MKKILCLFMILFSTLTLSGCRLFNNDQNESIVPENDDNVNMSIKSIPFKNLSNEYEMNETTINTYFINGGNVPYVSITNFLSKLDGFINCGDNLKYSFDSNSNLFTLAWTGNKNYTYTMETHWDTNKILINNFSFFNVIVKNTKATNYSNFIKYTDYYSYGEQNVLFNLGSYYFDIMYYNEKCLIPFVIANMLFCSQNKYNVFYNGDSYYGYYGEISTYDNEFFTIYNSSLNGKSCPNDVRKASVNSLLFAFDYFYGLKEDYKIDYFKKFINEDDLNLMLNNNSSNYMKGYRNVLIKQLDELHTRIDTPSIYNDAGDIFVYSTNDYGTFRNNFDATESELDDYKKAAFPDGISEVRYYGDTAIITFNSFKVGSNDELYDDNGNLKDTSWEYDSYYFMQHCMNDIKQHKEVKDILLDISQNGGGSIAAMERVLGFITDKVLKYATYDTLTNEYRINYYKVDTNSDGYYDDDAYDQYRWTLLTSINSFSAANTLTSCFKYQGLGKVIGQKTGGGMCSILSLVLADGTAITISSNNTIRDVDKNEEGKNIFYSIEKGIKPNLLIPYSDFYNDSKLVDYIDQVNN